MLKRLEKVDRILAFLEENIDEQHCKQVEKRHIDAIEGKTRNDLPLSIFCKSEPDLFSAIEAFNDPEKMLYNELVQAGEFGSVVNSVRIEDDYPLQIRSNHGIATSHNLVGGKYVVNEGATPWAIHEESITEYRRAWEDKEYDIHAGVPGKVMSTYQYFSERLSEYPVCKRCIRLSPPDMQSPFSIAQSLMGNNFFYDLYDNPDDVHWLLEKITNVYIAFHRAFSPLINGTTIDGSSTYIMGAIFPGSVLLKEDTSVVCLSGDQIREFCRAYNDRIAAELGPISYHYCGRSLPFHNTIFGSPELRGINYGNPEMQNVADVCTYWRDKGAAVINWGFHQPPEFLYKSLQGVELYGFTCCCSVDDIKQGAELIERYRSNSIEGLARII